MKLVIQRVKSASVTINGDTRRSIGQGLVILLGICPADTERHATWLAGKASGLRIFEDDSGAMNRSLLDVGGACLVVSNFTLYANCKKGRRPSFTDAAPPAHAEPLYRFFVRALAEAGVQTVETGEFGADMLVDIQNDGPVTVILDTDEIMPK